MRTNTWENKCLTQRNADYTLPCLTSSFNNQELHYYVPGNGATLFKNVISIPSNSEVYRVYFQSQEFTVLSDAHAIRWKPYYDKMETIISAIHKLVVEEVALYTDRKSKAMRKAKSSNN